MTDPIDELLRSFRAEAPEPDAAQRARAFARATGRRRRPHARMPVAVAIAVVAVAALALALVVPGRRDVSAATVIQRVVAATAPAQSGILHLRYETVGVPFAGAGKTIHVTVESWRELGGAHRSRTVSDAIVPPATLEVYGGKDGMVLYDPRTNGLYDLTGRSLQPLGPSSSAPVFAYSASTLRDQLERGDVADVWKVTRAQLDGRDVFRIERRTPGNPFQVRSVYVDARTYVPVRVDEGGFPRDQPGGPYAEPRRGWTMGSRYAPSVTVTTIQTYETLPEDGAELDPAVLHPGARSLPVAELRPDVAARVGGSGPTQPPPAATPALNVRPLRVDPAAGTVGAFRLGDNLLAASRLVPAPFDSFEPLPGNVQDAMLAGHADGAGVLVVTFADGNEQHATSLYLDRPFTTTRGDANGTALDAFLAHWPEHGAPTPDGSRTAVDVGNARFFFDEHDRLVGVQVGKGDAADYADLVRPR
jgi:hypothetical protein